MGKVTLAGVVRVLVSLASSPKPSHYQLAERDKKCGDKLGSLWAGLITAGAASSSCH